MSAPTDTITRPSRTVDQIDADLAEATRRRQLHLDDPVTTASNMRAIDALLDERLEVTE